MHINRFACLALGATLTACGSSGDPTTSSTTSSTDASSSSSGVGGGASTSTSTSSSGTGGDGGAGGGSAAACTPTAGSKAIDAYCDQIKIAVLEHDGKKAGVAIRGRLSTTAGACLRVDTVDVVRADASVIQSFTVSGVALKSDDDAPWVTGDAAPELAQPCSSDTPRAEAFSVIVKGATDGGTFTGTCGSISGGSSWPPRVLLTCHENLDEPPRSGNAFIQSSIMGSTLTQMSITFPESAKITAVDPAVRILPAVWMGAPISPFDTAGWMSSTSTANGLDNVYLSQSADPLGTELCPVQPTMPDPMMKPPPIFLARIKGQAAGAAFSSEVFMSFCTRMAM